MESDHILTVREFVNILLESIYINNKSYGSFDDTDVLYKAQRMGIIEDFDLLSADNPISKRNVARIVHNTLTKIINEKDEDDWSVAQYLKDIYDCHRCVAHIAQVYAKGIIPGKSKVLFGNHETVDYSTAKTIIDRLWNTQNRIAPAKIERAKINIVWLGELDEYLTNMTDYIIIDVRDRETYLLNPVIEGSINIPLKHVFLNPYMVHTDKNIKIILFCEDGYLSELSAKILVDHGYINVDICHE